jgi:hypothetical protein
VWACQIKQETVSLSGTVTSLLYELELLDDPRLKGISLFHPIEKNLFKGKRYPGGVMIAQKTLKELQGKTIFFDESSELAKRLKNAGLTKLVEVKTRGLDPFESTENTLRRLEPYLSNCPTEVLRVRLWAANEKQYLLSRKKLRHPLFFFLGEIKGEKLPELMMVHDGPVLFWTRNDRIHTLKSDLPYVRWGEKWRKGLSEQAAFVGLAELKAGEKFRLEKGPKRYWNVKDVGVLTPGPWQIRFMRKFVDTWREL